MRPSSDDTPRSSARAGTARWLVPLASIIALGLAGCGGDDASEPEGDAKDGSDGAGHDNLGGHAGSGGDDGDPNQDEPGQGSRDWFTRNTIAHRVRLPLAGAGARLGAQQLVDQLAGYDPGSLLRCELAEDPDYAAAIDELGGVTWGYSVGALEDLGKPRFQSGLQRIQRTNLYPGAATTGDAAAPAAVEIVKPDIVAVTDDAALFYSQVHGLMLVDLTDEQPVFTCATQLPGRVDQFFFHDGHLVAMTKQLNGTGSFLVHLTLDGTALGFVETVGLGDVSILDSRRFNEKLVFYTDLRIEPAKVAPPPQTGVFPGGGFAAPAVEVDNGNRHRALRVFTLGDTLQEELYDTLIDSTLSEAELINRGVEPTTAVGTVLTESRRFGTNMWASDHYFAVAEEVTQTTFAGWTTQSYSTCSASHTVEVPYEHCETIYEARPNPFYTPPDNSGGDRACKGVTLADCLRDVARVSNETIQVPVRRTCETLTRQEWICDAYTVETVDIPTFGYDHVTRLFIYEYQPAGFVRLDTSVHEITTPGLDALQLSDEVPTLTTSTETFELSVQGSVQTLQFQNGMLYVISQGVLQVYALSDSSLVRTASLPVVNDSLQSSLFAQDKLYLSDFGYRGGMDQSVLKVVDLSNPAFPTVEAQTFSLPGGHSTILAARHGIFTIGAVHNFDGANINAIKLGLFSDPFVEEQAYLILATELENTYLHAEESLFFSGSEQRLVLPYWGQDAEGKSEERVSLSRIDPGEIVSEGAVLLPEPAQRVRAADPEQTSFLTFATNSIEWLTPNGAEWQAAPVLEYFVPFALLRVTDDDDYLEVQRLGRRCKVFLSNADAINQRAQGMLSEAFECGDAYVRAFDRTLLFADQAFEVDESAGIRKLTRAERDAIETRILQRQTCLLSEDLVDNVAIDYTEKHAQSEFTCVSPEELQRMTQEANGMVSTTPMPIAPGG